MTITKTNNFFYLKNNNNIESHYLFIQKKNYNPCSLTQIEFIDEICANVRTNSVNLFVIN